MWLSAMRLPKLEVYGREVVVVTMDECLTNIYL